MGFSLSNLLKQGAAQVNPFDHGQTAATVKVQQQKQAAAELPSPGQMAPQAVQQIQNAKYGVLANNPQAQQQFLHQQSVTPHFNPITAAPGAFAHAVNTTARGLGNSVVNTAQVPYSASRVVAANATGNKQALNNAHQALSSDTANNMVWNDAYRQTSNELAGAIASRNAMNKIEQSNNQLGTTIANAYGNSPQAKLYGDLVASAGKNQDINNYLGDVGLNQNTSKLQTGIRLGAPIVSAGAQTALNMTGAGQGAKLAEQATAKQAAKMTADQAAKKAGTDLLKTSLKYGTANAGISMLSPASQGDTNAMDYVKAGLSGFAGGAAFPIAGAALSKGAAPLLRAGNKVATDRIGQARNNIATQDGITSQQKQLAKEIQSHQKQQAALPANNHTAAEVLQRKIDTKTAQIQSLETSRPQQNIVSKATDRVLTAQPGLSMKAVTGHEDLNPQQHEFVGQYADMLKQQGQGNGVDILPDGRRVTNNMRSAADTGKRLTNADWFDRARAELESGKGAYGASDEYKALSQAHEAPLDIPAGFDAKPTASKTTPPAAPLEPVGTVPRPASRGTGGESLGNGIPKVSIPEDAPSSGSRTRGLAQTIQDDPNTPQAVKDKVNEVYKVRNTKDLQARAANLVKDDPATAHRVFESDSNSDTGAMIGSELAAHYSRTGQHDAAISIAERMAREATNRGQANQALSMWGKLAPESILRFAQKTVNEYNKAAELVGTKKELKLTPETAKSLTDTAATVQKMAPGREKDIATQQMVNKVKELIPASWVRKLGTGQTMAQLLNPKTIIRNIVGNGLLMPGENLSQTLATGIDKALSGIRGTQREVALPNLKTQAKGAIRGAKEQFQETTHGVNLGPETQFELGSNRTFRGSDNTRSGVLGTVVDKTVNIPSHLETGMNLTLRVPDRAAYQAAYDDTLRGLMKVNKTTVPTQEMIDSAHNEAAYRTFQNDSNASKLFAGLKHALNHIGFEGKDGSTWGLGDLITKYSKTPGNILNVGLDYSPVGIVKGLYEIAKPAIKGQPFSQRNFSMAVSRGVVGTAGLMGAGATLGALGIITEKPSQDTDTRNMQKSVGLGGYQINTSALRRFISSGFNKDAAKLKPGDKLVSYDWAQPASIPLSAGAAIGQGKGAKQGAASSIASAADGLNSLIEQPLVTGINNFSSNIKNKGVVGALGATVQGAPASFVPSASNQVRQMTDNTTRNTYDPNKVKETINLAKNRIPGLDRTLPAKVGPLGQDLKNYQNNSNNLFNVGFNPSTVTSYQPNGAAKLPLDILNKSGETQQMPRTIATTQKVNGQNIKLTPQQNTDLSKYVGQKTNEAFTALSNDKAFQALSPTDQAKQLSNKLTDITAAGKIQLLGNQPKTVSADTQAIMKGQTPAWTGNTVKKTPAEQTAMSEQDYSKDPNVQKNRNDMMKNLPKDMNGNDVATLQRFTGLPDAKKQEIFSKEPDAEYKLKLAEYERDSKLGKISGTDLQTKQNDVFKAQVGSQFPKEVRDVYGMSKDKATAYLANNPNGNSIANAVIAYGDSLAKNGIENNKFVDNKGVVGIVPKGTVIEAKSGRISQAAQKNGIPDNIFAALVRQESGGNQGAKSPVGAIGLTQLMPDTAKTLGVDPNNADQNLDGGARYLKQMYDKFGRWDYALAAYNAGPGAVEKYHGVPPYTETQNYVKSIMGMVNGGIKGNDLNLVLSDPNAASGGALNQSGVDTAASNSGPTSPSSIASAFGSTYSSPYRFSKSLRGIAQKASMGSSGTPKVKSYAKAPRAKAYKAPTGLTLKHRKLA